MKEVCSYFCCGACARNAGSEPAGCVRYLSDVTRRGMWPWPHRTYQEATPSMFFKFTHRTDTIPPARSSLATLPAAAAPSQQCHLSCTYNCSRVKLRRAPPLRATAHNTHRQAAKMPTSKVCNSSYTLNAVSLSPQNIHVCLSKPKITCRSKHLGRIMTSFYRFIVLFISVRYAPAMNWEQKHENHKKKHQHRPTHLLPSVSWK